MVHVEHPSDAWPRHKQHFLGQKGSICGTLWWEQSYVCWCPKSQHKMLLGNSVCWRRAATLCVPRVPWVAQLCSIPCQDALGH